MVEPLVEAQAQGRGLELLVELGGEERLVYGTGIETRHAGLHVLAVVCLGLAVDVAVHIVIQPVVVGTVEVDDGHRGLVDHGSARVVVLQRGLPVQSVVKAVAVHQRHLTGLVQAGVVERGLGQLACAHVTIGHLVVDGQIRGGTQFELAVLLHASVAHIDERGALCGVVVDIVAVGILIHGGKLATLVVVLLGEERLVDLRTVLVGRRLDFERTGVEVLVHVDAVEPVLTQVTVHVERELLQSEVVALVVERSVEALLTFLGKGVDGVADVAGGDGSLGNLEQTLVAQAGIAAPDGVDRVGIGGIGNGQAVLEHVDIGRWQTNLNLSRAVGAGCVEHHVAVALFLSVCIFVLCIRC